MKKQTLVKRTILFFLLFTLLSSGCRKKEKNQAASVQDGSQDNTKQADIVKGREEKGPAAPGQLVEVEAMADKSTASIGDIIIYKVNVKAPEHITPRIPEMGSQITGLRIIDFGSEGPKKTEGRNTWEKWYKLQADLTGSYIIPPVRVAYQDPNGKQLEATAPQIFIEVQSVIKEGDETGDIRDLKPIEKQKGNLLTLYLVIGTGLIILIAGGLLPWFFLKKRKKQGTKVKIQAHEIALKGMDQLIASGYLEQEDYRSFYFRLSEIFRAYIEARYGFPAQESTTEELIPSIEKLPLSRAQKDIIRKLIRWEDLVKFAKHIPTQEKSRQDWEETRTLILLTREKPDIADQEVE